jgi:N-acetylmuramoyl-L-alanine amidase
MKTIVLDPGHGGWDTGAIALDGGRECDFNLALAFAVRDQLTRYECQVVMTRQADVGLSPRGNLAEELNRRCQIANAAGADLLVSLHHDNTGNPAVQGASLWIWTSKTNADGSLQWLPATGNQTDPKTLPVAQAMVGPIRTALGALGVPWRSWGDPEGIACSNFGVLRGTRGSALLIECFHGSNVQDLAAARRPEFIHTLAATVADSIAGALGLPVVAPVDPDAISVTVNGAPVMCGARIEGGKTRVDLRALTEALGASVGWDEATRTVTVTKGAK